MTLQLCVCISNDVSRFFMNLTYGLNLFFIIKEVKIWFEVAKNTTQVGIR